jgi:hypothetical protein
MEDQTHIKKSQSAGSQEKEKRMTTEEARTKGIILLTEEQIVKPNTGAANILRAARDEFTKSHSREPDAMNRPCFVPVATTPSLGQRTESKTSARS